MAIFIHTFSLFSFRAQTFPFAAYIYLWPKLLTVNAETIFLKLSSTEVCFVSVRDTAKVVFNVFHRRTSIIPRYSFVFWKISFQFKMRKKETNTKWFETAFKFHHQPYLIIKTSKHTRLNQKYCQVYLNNEMIKASHLLSEFSITKIQERFYLQRCSSLNICTELTMSIADHMINSNFAIKITIFFAKYFCASREIRCFFLLNRKIRFSY